MAEEHGGPCLLAVRPSHRYGAEVPRSLELDVRRGRARLQGRLSLRPRQRAGGSPALQLEQERQGAEPSRCSEATYKAFEAMGNGTVGCFLALTWDYSLRHERRGWASPLPRAKGTGRAACAVFARAPPSVQKRRSPWEG